MVLNPSHSDYTKQSAEGQKKMRDGLCPQCGNDTFRQQGVGFGVKVWVCTGSNCSFAASTTVFKPQRAV